RANEIGDSPVTLFYGPATATEPPAAILGLAHGGLPAPTAPTGFAPADPATSGATSSCAPAPAAVTAAAASTALDPALAGPPAPGGGEAAAAGRSVAGPAEDGGGFAGGEPAAKRLAPGTPALRAPSSSRLTVPASSTRLMAEVSRPSLDRQGMTTGSSLANS